MSSFVLSLTIIECVLYMILGVFFLFVFLQKKRTIQNKKSQIITNIVKVPDIIFTRILTTLKPRTDFYIEFSLVILGL